MATGDAMLPSQATIYIVDSSTTPGSTHMVQAEVTNFSQSGGVEDFESRFVFGGGNIDLTKPREQLEVSFDVILRYGADARKWDKFVWGSTYSAGGTPVKQYIYVQFSDGTNYYTRAYKNAKGISFDPDVASDDLVSGTVSFKLSPTDANGNKQFIVASTAASSVSWS